MNALLCCLGHKRVNNCRLGKKRNEQPQLSKKAVGQNDDTIKLVRFVKKLHAEQEKT